VIGYVTGTRIVLVAAVCLATACSSTAPMPAPTFLGVCALVPNMDELVGKSAVADPGGFSLNDVDQCIWTYALNPSRSVNLSVASAAAHAAAISELGDGEQLSGVGDNARWWVGNHLLSVVAGDQAVQVSVNLDEAETKDLAVRIAQAAISNMN